MIRLLSPLLVLCLLSGCQTSNLTSDRSGEGAGAGRPALSQVAGIWSFSHLGPSPVSEGADELMRVAKENMSGARISIEPDGSASMLVVGQSGAFSLDVREETPIYIKLGSSGGPGQETVLTYDKATRQLALPLKVEMTGSSKSLPAYFKRKRR